MTTNRSLPVNIYATPQSGTYFVSSETKPGVHYRVIGAHVGAPICTCPAGMVGRMCKHARLALRHQCDADLHRGLGYQPPVEEPQSGDEFAAMSADELFGMVKQPDVFDRVKVAS
jgi:hypothetical protein